MRSDKRKVSFHAPLNVLDSEKQTFGCWHTNPDICSKNELERVCAFVRSDGVCKSPPMSWTKQSKKLSIKSGVELKKKAGK
jgi:hypothetical protein